MTTKSMMYDHPAYMARLAHSFGAVSAGSGAVTGKFVAFTAMLVMSIQATLVTAGTSTSTLYNGTATVTSINGQNFSLIRIFNTAASGAAPALATATYGPYVLSNYNGTSTATQTNASGVSVNIPLYGTGGSGAQQTGAPTAPGGLTINQGDQLNIVTGTDATATSVYALELALQQNASVTA